jgi:hypothetical protein
MSASPDLEVLKWARERGCEWDSETCHQAAGGAHIHVLVWLQQNWEWVMWDWETCAAAAAGGHLETLKWLRAGAYTRPLFGST